MGVLDDAIREHLELKRQHGAADSEIRRAEQEALGPARRDLADLSQPDQAAGAAPLADAAPVSEPLHEPPDHGHLTPDPVAPAPQGDPVTEEASSLQPPVDEAPTEYMPPATQVSPQPEPPAPAPTQEGQLATPDVRPVDEPHAGEEVVDGEADPFPEPEAPPPAAAPTVMSQVPDAPAAPPPEPVAEEEPEFEPHPVSEAPVDERNERDDLLEDTPDFLQETPEHDRLWFEQKPPRDFDFED